MNGNYVQESFTDYLKEVRGVDGHERILKCYDVSQLSGEMKKAWENHAASFTNRVYTEMLHFEGMNRAKIGAQIRDFCNSIKENDMDANLFGMEMIKTFADPVRKDMHPEYRLSKN